jgi:DNA-binding ferritin-like protein (Dps family)
MPVVDFFEEGAARRQGVLDLVGSDVAAFCDDLVKDAPTNADLYQQSARREPGES